MPLHDGCFNCGDEKQDTLDSKTVTVVSLKKDKKSGEFKTNRAIASVALCRPCFPKTMIDLRESAGKTMGV